MLRNRQEPIITSWLDLDFYKFTMGLLVWKQFPDVQVRYVLKLRNKGKRLIEMIDMLRLEEELESARTIGFNKTDLHYLRGTNEYGERMFPEAYLKFLEGIKALPRVIVIRGSDELHVEVKGPWPIAIFWETLVLSIVNELHYEFELMSMTKLERASIEANGLSRLKEKVDVLKKHPDIKFSDFGTRRRFSKSWQYRVDEFLTEEFANTDQFLGTSCVKSAERFGLLPMGTNAHELQMVCAALAKNDEELKASHNQVLRDWWSLYETGLSIALTDTFGTEFFFRDFTQIQAVSWKGLRHDSGDPVIFGNQAIHFYKRNGIAPENKLLVFSDGLELPKIVELQDRFKDRIRTTFGWGTNLTNDLGLPALSLVMKAVEANGRPTVKLSDNLAKATGPEQEIVRYKRVFGYDENPHAFIPCDY